MSINRYAITIAIFALLTIIITSCSNYNTVYQDGLYYSHAIEKAKVVMPSNG